MSPRRFAPVVLVLLSGPVTAQTTPEQKPDDKAAPEQEPAPEMMEDPEVMEEPECPEVLRGASLEVREQPSGVALTFTARTDEQKAELHELVYAAGAFIEYRSKLGELHPEAKLSYDDEPVPPVDIDVSNLKKARIHATIRAEDPKDRATVVALAKRFKQHWDDSGCTAGGSPIPVSRV